MSILILFEVNEFVGVDTDTVFFLEIFTNDVLLLNEDDETSEFVRLIDDGIFDIDIADAGCCSCCS